MSDDLHLVALLHIDPLGDELHGVWVCDGDVPEAYYSSDDMSPEHQYGETVVLGAAWSEQLEHLPTVSPYTAHWAVVERHLAEPAEAVFRRLHANS